MDYNTDFDNLEAEEQPRGFVIDSHEKADWAIQKIKEERERRDIFKTVADRQIEELKQKKADADKKCELQTGWLLAALDAYLDTVPAKETKTQRVFDLPSGRIVRKFASCDFDYDEPQLLAYLHTEAPDYIKTTEKIAWGEFKKDLQIVGNVVVRKSTGAVVGEVRAVERPGSVEVK